MLTCIACGHACCSLTPQRAWRSIQQTPCLGCVCSSWQGDSLHFGKSPTQEASLQRVHARVILCAQTLHGEPRIMTAGHGAPDRRRHVRWHVLDVGAANGRGGIRDVSAATHLRAVATQIHGRAYIWVTLRSLLIEPRCLYLLLANELLCMVLAWGIPRVYLSLVGGCVSRHCAL